MAIEAAHQAPGLLEALLFVLLVSAAPAVRAKSGGDPIFPPEPKFPTITYANDSTMARIERDFTAVKTKYLLVGDDKWFLPESYLSQGPVYFGYETFHDNVWLVNHPKSCTPWAQDAIWLLTNDLDYESAETKELDSRFPYFEANLPSNKNKSQVSDTLLSKPKYLRTHLPLSLVPQILKSGSKTVYFAKNPKDTAVSFYHQLIRSPDFEFVGSFKKFWNYFQNDETIFSPYWSHLKEGWSQRENIRFLFLFCEEVAADPKGVLMRLAAFFDKSYTPEQYGDLVEYLQYRHKVEVETWKDYFTTELNEQANQWFIANLENTDIVFPHINVFG